MAGRRDESRQMLAELRNVARIPAFHAWMGTLLAWVERRTPDLLAGMEPVASLRIMQDPEAIFQQGWMLCDLGEHRRGLEYLRRAVAGGYLAVATLAERPQFDALRGDAGFEELMAEARAGRQRALDAFHEAGGERLLGFWQARFARLDDFLKQLQRDEGGQA
jgi:hypothetical protein